MRNKIISLVLILSMLFYVVGCSTKGESSATVVTLSPYQDPNSPYAGDDLVEISIKDLNVNEIDVVSIKPSDIVVNSAEIQEIQSIELQIVPMNDQLVSLAYDNFEAVYGDDINYPKLIGNIAATVVIVVVVAVVVYVTGGSATWFGAIVLKEWSKVLIGTAIGAAIDASVSGYQAYQEGGDLQYILGHMCNGVAEGLMWSAILAPLEFGFQGLKVLKAAKWLKKIPAFSNLDNNQLSKMLKNIAEVIKKTKNVDSNAADDTIRALYRELSDKVRSEISEEVFVNMVRNKSTLISIARTINPLGIRSGVVDALRDNLWDKCDNVSRDVINQVIKNIQNGTTKSIDEISDSALKNFILENSVEFIDCYSDKLPKSFLDNWLKKLMGEDVLATLANNINKSNGTVEIVKQIGIKELQNILNDPTQYMLLANRFGVSNVARLRSADALCKIMRGSQTTVTDDIVTDVLRKLLDGKFASISDIPNNAIKTNIRRSPETFASLINSLGVANKNKNIMRDLALGILTRIEGLPDIDAKNIIDNKLNKAAIINTYGDDIWNKLVADSNRSICALGINSNSSSGVIEDLARDALISKGITDDAITSILRADNIKMWNLTDKQIASVGNIVSEYYRATDVSAYESFILDLAESRGESIKDAVAAYAKNNTITNVKYAGGVMVPTGNVDDILARYGQINMSSKGFPIFDKYAVARVEISNLTGDEAADIARANMLHHGTQQSIPGYTWHHLEDGKTLILIPSDLHEAYRHTGGAALIREGVL